MLCKNRKSFKAVKTKELNSMVKAVFFPVMRHILSFIRDNFYFSVI